MEFSIAVSRHAESKSGLRFELALLLHGDGPLFIKAHIFLSVFRKALSFLVKLGSQIF